MNKLQKKELKKKLVSREWKEKNISYLNALDKFFDIVDNVEDEKLKMDIIFQMLKCDEILTRLAEENWNNIE